MSSKHGGIIAQKPISEMAKYIKTLIPANIPENYALKPMFISIAHEENIRKGVVAFRDFLLLFCDRLISDGHLYVKLKKNPKSHTDYPFLDNIISLLINIGYNSEIAVSGDSLIITDLLSLTDVIGGEGQIRKNKMPFPIIIEGLQFLTLCGFVFDGINFESDVLNVGLIKISYPDNPIMLTGLKTMSIAHIDLGLKKTGNCDIFSRCDYRVIKTENTEVIDILKDFLYPLSLEVQKIIIDLHNHFLKIGFKCEVKNGNEFIYWYKQKRIYTVISNLNEGYLLLLKAKNTDKYIDVIKKFPLHLQELISRGFGCDSKLRGERCQGGCRGYRIALDDSILVISKEVKIWIDNEVLFLQRK